MHSDWLTYSNSLKCVKHIISEVLMDIIVIVTIDFFLQCSYKYEIYCAILFHVKCLTYPNIYFLH